MPGTAGFRTALPLATASFSTPQPSVVIGTPTPTSPINNTTTATVRPTLRVTNGTVTGDDLEQARSLGSRTAQLATYLKAGGMPSAY